MGIRVPASTSQGSKMRGDPPRATTAPSSPDSRRTPVSTNGAGDLAGMAGPVCIPESYDARERDLDEVVEDFVLAEQHDSYVCEKSV
jgi:hypothetical protein